jgi:hypothetical protein
MAMSSQTFDVIKHFQDDRTENTLIIEATPSTRLERRRKIEDLIEQKQLEDELSEFG